MLIFLFLVLLVCFGIFYYITNQKMELQKTQLKIMSKQNKDFKSKVNSYRSSLGPIIIKYKQPLFKTAITKENCNLYICPLETSSVLSNVIKNTSVDIQDSAEILNVTWYEVSLKSQTNINNKGWIKKDSLLTLDDTVNNQEETPI